MSKNKPTSQQPPFTAEEIAARREARIAREQEALKLAKDWRFKATELQYKLNEKDRIKNKLLDEPRAPDFKLKRSKKSDITTKQDSQRSRLVDLMYNRHNKYLEYLYKGDKGAVERMRDINEAYKQDVMGPDSKSAVKSRIKIGIGGVKKPPTVNPTPVKQVFVLKQKKQHYNPNAPIKAVVKELLGLSSITDNVMSAAANALLKHLHNNWQQEKNIYGRPMIPPKPDGIRLIDTGALFNSIGVTDDYLIDITDANDNISMYYDQLNSYNTEWKVTIDDPTDPYLLNNYNKFIEDMLLGV